MYKQLLLFFTLALLVQESVTKDKPTSPGEYTPDPILKYSNIDCLTGKSIEPKPEGTTRIAVVGDSTTLGVGSSRVQLEFEYQYQHVQFDGSKAGFFGYPYLLSQLLKNHNTTQKYQVINLANDNFTVIEEADGKSYKDMCEYKQLMSSNPDIVISMIGGKDSFQKSKFTEEGFVKNYGAFLSELQNMPSKPQIMLVTPSYSAASVLAEKEKPFMFNALYGKNFNLTESKLVQWDHSQTDVASLVAQVGKKNNIPMENLIDTEELLKMKNKNTMSDTIHPNEHGYGILAQELYMKLAFNRNLKDKVTMIQEQTMDLNQWQNFTVNENKLRQAAALAATKSPGIKLTQEELSRSKIELSQKCHDQTYLQAQEALLPGLKFNFQIPTPKKYNEIRIAVAGDSATQGYGGTTQKQVLAVSADKRLTDQTDGSQHGLQGWPYLLHSLLQNNNQSTDYTIMNYGVQDATIIADDKHQSFMDDCRYEMLQKSLPNFVFLSFGSMDVHLKKYTEEKFVDAYVKLIKETQKMPTRPMVFLMVPVSTCRHQLNVDGNLEKYEAFVTNSTKCGYTQTKDMQETMLKIAEKTEIPRGHVINAWSMLRDPKRKEAAIAEDDVHPNLKGMGEIAQEFFMKMSLSPNFLSRQKKILAGEDDIYNKAIKRDFEKIGHSYD